MTSPLIFNIQRFSLHDGDGVRTVVFFKGCPLRCAWCSNPESQQFQPELLFDASKCIGCRDCVAASGSGEIVWDNGPRIDRSVRVTPGVFDAVCPAEALTVAGERKSIDEIIGIAEKDKVFYKTVGGITLSGGEPFAQPEAARDLLRAAKGKGLSTGVETCLAVPWKNIEPSLPFLDAAFTDVKHVDPEKYRQGTGGDICRAEENLRHLVEHGVKIVARVPVIPGFNDTPEELEAIVRHIRGFDKIVTLHLMPYHSFGEGKYALLDRVYPLASIPSTPPESLEETARKLADPGLTIHIGG